MLLVAVAAGAAAMSAVYWMMQACTELQADGTVRIQRAVGQHGNVYLRIPANRSGSGKIQFNLQNRTMEYLAVTSGPELPTGTKVVVVGVVNPTTLEVQPINRSVSRQIVSSVTIHGNVESHSRTANRYSDSCDIRLNSGETTMID